MIISQLRVQRFRSILDETLECGHLTILMGRNGAGKSAFVQALRLFMDTAAVVKDEDYYNRETDKQILVEVTFTDLTRDEQSEFASYTHDGLLVVQRRFPGGDYYGQATGCEAFEPLRDRLRRKAAKVEELVADLQQLVDSGLFPGLKVVRRSLEDELTRWEAENPERCKPYFRAGLFQGPTNIAGGKLRNRCQFVYVPPVREAEADATAGGRSSALTSLVAPLVKAITDGNQDVSTARDALKTGYTTYRTAVQAAPEKGGLESELTAILRRYEERAEARVQLALGEELPLPPVSPTVWLVEDHFEGDVARKGHGLQRLFIFSVLELYGRLRDSALGVDAPGTMVLAIEEPELYQHPARARALARTLSDLSSDGKSRTLQFQIFLTTHSPYFVGIDDFQCVRRVEKMPCTSGPMESRVRFTTLAAVNEQVLAALGRESSVTEASAWARLKSIVGLKASEGLFADGVILVEGDEDEAVLAALAEKKGVSLDAANIAVVPSGGKTKLPNLLAMYRGLGIRVFTVFDADCDKASDETARVDYNQALMKMNGLAPEARPSTKVLPFLAIWNTRLAAEVAKGFGGEAWEEAFAAASAEFSIPVEQARKKAAVIGRTIEHLHQKGLTCRILEDLWVHLAAFVDGETAPPQ